MEFLQGQNGNLQISKERIKSDPLAMAIVEMINAMQADFGAKFLKQFGDSDALKNFKRRLYQKLRNLPIDAIVDGYELCISRNTEFCPTVPDIYSATLEAVKENKKREENKAEVERISALPPPTISCNPLEMLKKAKISGQKKKETSEERIVRRAEILKNHEAILVLHSHKIYKRYAGPEHGCAYGGCHNAGTISSGTTGKGNFYCATHFRMV